MRHSYMYRAARADGRVLRGRVEAASNSEAAAALIERGLLPIRLEAGASTPPSTAAPRRDLAVVFRSLASLLGAGLSLDRTVAATVPIARGALRATLERARERLTQGEPLASALDDGRGTVPALALAMLRAGERAGRLTQALDQVATQLEHEADLASRLRQALAYPMLLAVGGSVSIAVIVTLVIPRFATILGDLGQKLPTSTALLLSLAAWFGRWWPVLMVMTLITALGFVFWFRTAAGRSRVHEALLGIPLVGETRLALGSTRFLQGLASSLEAGMPLVPALAIARDAADDAALTARLARAAEQVLQGRPLSGSLEQERALSPVGLQLLAVGESSGQLAAMAARAAAVLSLEVERRLQGAVKLIEPALILLFGGLIAFVSAALLQAVYSLRPM